MRQFLWMLTIIGAVSGGVILFFRLIDAKSASQGAAIGIACAVIPYCLARATSEIDKIVQKGNRVALCQ